MTTTIQPLTKSKAWKSLATHSKEIKKLHLRQLFAQDTKRGERFIAQAAGLFLDYSKNRITDQTLELLLQLAAESGLREKIDAMFGGD
jgi:glucose-6-phosphate isomerase